jgi:antitoxin (DNA-binding transcriptional repressor) of toxin-antitoxin stability system
MSHSITRHGKPVARLIPSSGGINREQARQAAQRIRARAHLLKPEAFDWESTKADRDYGRP